MRRVAATFLSAYIAAIATLVILAIGCAFSDKVVVRAEEGLAMGQKSVDLFVEAKISRCRLVLDMPTEAERDACVAEASALLDRTDPVVEAASAAIAAYWSARRVKDYDGARKAFQDLVFAVGKLPPEHFGEVQRALERVP